MTWIAALLDDVSSLWMLLVIASGLLILAWHRGPDR